MKIDLTPEIVITWISKILKVPFRIDGNDVEFDFTGEYEEYQKREKGENPQNTFPTEVNLKRKLSLSEIQVLLETLKTKDEYQDCGIFDKYSYEILVTEKTYFAGVHLKDDTLTLDDPENEITYTLSTLPSDYLLIYLLYKISKVELLDQVIDYPFQLGRRLADTNQSVLDILKSSVLGFVVLKISSKKAVDFPQFIKYANSFFFHTSFNLNVAIIPQRGFEELLRFGRIEQLRRSTAEELVAPNRFYNSDLVHYYQEGVASDSPSLQYLSYYHVAEHFFEAVYNDDLIERVKYILTQPDFSYKRKKDINGLIKKIGKWVSFRDDTMVFNEQEALALTLQNYVDLNTLVQKIKEHDSSLIEYYKTNIVSFSGGEMVNFEDNNRQAVWLLLAKRIYKTRNSIVHSKENERGKYVPFEHEKILDKEVPLIRLIAELIITGSSEIMQ